MIRNTWIRLWDFPVAFRFGQALLLNNIRFFDKFFDTGYRMYCGCLWFPLNGISALKHGICIRSTIASKTLDRHWISDANTVFRFFFGPDVGCWTAWTTHPLFFHRYFDYVWLVLVSHISGSQMLWPKMLHFAGNQHIIKKQTNKTKNHEWCTQKSDFQTRPS